MAEKAGLASAASKRIGMARTTDLMFTLQEQRGAESGVSGAGEEGAREGPVLSNESCSIAAKPVTPRPMLSMQ